MLSKCSKHSAASTLLADVSPVPFPWTPCPRVGSLTLGGDSRYHFANRRGRSRADWFLSSKLNANWLLAFAVVLATGLTVFLALGLGRNVQAEVRVRDSARSPSVGDSWISTHVRPEKLQAMDDVIMGVRSRIGMSKMTRSCHHEWIVLKWQRVMQFVMFEIPTQFRALKHSLAGVLGVNHFSRGVEFHG